ncbi:MAG: zinc ribbon domain-containing protein [Planctomycetes bacterium]|nr:zinc ribbon domain-containing protein [Planctomycetota bacterium]
MPTYDYVCKACEDAFDHFQTMTSDPLTDCAKCGGKGTLKRLIGKGAALIFKGSGFYETDYKRTQKSTPTKGTDSSGDRDSRGKPDEGKLTEKVERTKEAAKDVKAQAAQTKSKGGDA